MATPRKIHSYSPALLDLLYLLQEPHHQWILLVQDWNNEARSSSLLNARSFLYALRKSMALYRDGEPEMSEKNLHKFRCTLSVEYMAMDSLSTPPIPIADDDGFNWFLERVSGYKKHIVNNLIVYSPDHYPTLPFRSFTTYKHQPPPPPVTGAPHEPSHPLYRPYPSRRNPGGYTDDFADFLDYLREPSTRLPKSDRLQYFGHLLRLPIERFQEILS